MFPDEEEIVSQFPPPLVETVAVQEIPEPSEATRDRLWAGGLLPPCCAENDSVPVETVSVAGCDTVSVTATVTEETEAALEVPIVSCPL